MYRFQQEITNHTNIQDSMAYSKDKNKLTETIHEEHRTLSKLSLLYAQRTKGNHAHRTRGNQVNNVEIQ